MQSSGSGAAFSSPQRTPVEAVVIAVAVGLLALGVVFRAQATGDFLWLDEQHTAWVAKSDFGEVAVRAADGNQTPLFFYASWASLMAGGQSALSLRLPSLLCGLGLLVVVPWFVFRRTGDVVSLLLVSAWLVFDYDAVFYASEARPYAMVQLLGAIQAAVFFTWVSQLFHNPPRRLMKNNGGIVTASLTASLTAAIFYAHPTGILLVVAELCFLTGYCLWMRRWPWLKIGGTALLGAVLMLPGVALIGFVWQRRSNWTSVSNAEEVFWKLASEAGLMVVLPLGVLVVDRIWRKRNLQSERSGQRDLQTAAATEPERDLDDRLSHGLWDRGNVWGRLAFVGCWAIVPRLMIVSLDSAGWVSLAIDRYAIVGAVAFPVFAAFAVAAVGRRWLRWLTVAVLLVGLGYPSQVYRQLSGGGFRHENWRQVVEMINAQDSALPVFLVANLIEDNAALTDRSDRFQSYLRFPLTGIPGLRNPCRIQPRPSQGVILSEQNVSSIVQHRGGFVVVRDAEIYRDAIRLEITTALNQDRRTQAARLFVAPVDRPQPNNVHLFWIQLPASL